MIPFTACALSFSRAGLFVLNPIYVDPLKARNGGILFQKDEIFRINQKIDFNSYGKEFNVNKIIKVDEIFSEYEFEVEENHCDLYFWGIKND